MSCNTLTPQIKVKHGATNLMFPFGPGQHHDVALEDGIPFLPNININNHANLSSYKHKTTQMFEKLLW